MVSQAPDAIQIAWTEPENNDLPITSYDIYWNGLNPDVLEYTKLVTVAPYFLTYTIDEVSPGLVYKFKILATNQVGDSALSSPVTIKAAQVPDAPAQPTLVFQSPTVITIEWVAPHDNFDPILDYIVRWDLGTSSWEILTSSTGNQL